MNFFVQIGIFNSNADLVSKGDESLKITVVKRFSIQAINGLEDPQKTAVSRDRHTDHIARHKAADLIHMTKKPRIVLNIINDERLPRTDNVPGNALPTAETRLSNHFLLFSMGDVEKQFTRGFIQQEK